MTSIRVAIAAAATLLSVNAAAHHPVLGKFDASSPMTLEGVVTKVDWRNPHVHLFVNVAGPEQMLNWAVELESPIELQANGWTNETIRPGETIVVEGITARNGTRQIWGEHVALARNGREIFTVGDGAPGRPLATRPAPRWPNGQVALGAAPGTASGYWAYPSAMSLVEDGRNVDVNRYGLLEDISDARRVAPMQDWYCRGPPGGLQCRYIGSSCNWRS